jgi:nucleoside-diphosphate-sugar epimerase
VAQPVRTLDAFHLHEKRLRYGFMAYGATGVLLACHQLAQGTRPKPWALPVFPAFIAMGFVMLASWFHPFAKALRGKGDYKATLAYLGLPTFALRVVFVVVDILNLYLLAFGAGIEIRIRDLVALICRLMGFRGEVRWNDAMPDGQPRRCLDTSRAERLFCFRATTSFEEGLRRTVEWYRSTRALG